MTGTLQTEQHGGLRSLRSLRRGPTSTSTGAAEALSSLSSEAKMEDAIRMVRTACQQAGVSTKPGSSNPYTSMTHEKENPPA